MRRFAVMLAISLALSGACTEHLMLPADKPDGGSGGVAAGSGGAVGSGGGSGGIPGSGGRGLGTGGFASTGGTSGSGGRPGGGGMPTACAGQLSSLGFDTRHAQIVLAVGRNASMSTPFGTNGVTRMSAVQDAVRVVLDQYDQAVFFAYEGFPSPVSCSNGNSCCANSKFVYPAPENYNLIDGAISECFSAAKQPGCTSSSSSRPIADVFRNVLTPSERLDPILGPWTQQSERRVILLTDGPPSCSSEPDAAVSCNQAQSQLSQLQSKNVHVDVVPISDEAESEPSGCLRALAGGTTNEPFMYHARTPMELSQSLTRIVADAAKEACVLFLFQIPVNPNNVFLTIARKPISPDPDDGWTLLQGGIIELRGQACRDAQMGGDIAIRECL